MKGSGTGLENWFAPNEKAGYPEAEAAEYGMAGPAAEKKTSASDSAACRMRIA